MVLDNEDVTEIYKEIGSLIWSIFPEEGIEAVFLMKIYDSFTETMFYWKLLNGIKKTHQFGDNSADETEKKIMALLKKLQKNKMFKKEQWTHCKVSLTDNQKFNIKFAYIPYEEELVGVFMKGMADLSQEEAYDKYDISKEEWEKIQINTKEH